MEVSQKQQYRCARCMQVGKFILTPPHTVHHNIKLPLHSSAQCVQQVTKTTRQVIKHSLATGCNSLLEPVAPDNVSLSMLLGGGGWVSIFQKRTIREHLNGPYQGI